MEFHVNSLIWEWMITYLSFRMIVYQLDGLIPSLDEICAYEITAVHV